MPPTTGPQSALQKAEDMVTAMLAKGFVLGKDALEKAKDLDETHQITSTASAKVTSLDRKIGLTEKMKEMDLKVKEMDQKYQVTEKTRTTLAAAEQTISNAGSALMKNRCVLVLGDIGLHLALLEFGWIFWKIMQGNKLKQRPKCYGVGWHQLKDITEFLPRFSNLEQVNWLMIFTGTVLLMLCLYVIFIS